MQLLTAHKILIGTAIVMFIVYGGVEIGHYLGGDTTALAHVAVAAVSSVALALYLRWVWIHRPGGGADDRTNRRRG
ncbi:MAG: hypothetical protein HY270_01650 [Deltaproteobacteria bacterium]|nr:hypothetical protein [Deltaproteobacteria bacterium]